jgi:GntR family transcriptional repressor for pyruvate dehydrogenase complex
MGNDSSHLPSGEATRDGTRDAARPGLLFAPVAPDYAFQKVAAAIRQAMARGELSPGDRLPPQHELQRAFGVSKFTVVEALRVLEADGLLRVQVGRSGGAVVLDPSRHSLSRSIGLLLDMDRVNIEEVRELRATVETRVARLAARNARPGQVAHLESLLGRLEQLTTEAAAAQGEGQRDGQREGQGGHPGEPDYARFGALDLEFHAALSEASGNRLLHACMDVLYHHVIRFVARVDVRELDRLNRSLRRLLEAGIKAGDPDAAAQAMEQHLTDSYRIITASARRGRRVGRERKE